MNSCANLEQVLSGLRARSRQSCLQGGPRESAVSVPLGCTFPDVWTRNDEHVKKVPVFWYRHVVQKDKKAISLMLASEKAACARTYPRGEPKSKNKICSERKKKGVYYESVFCSQCAGLVDAYLPGCELCGTPASAPSTGRTASWTCCCSRTGACAPSWRTASAPCARWTWSRRSPTSAALRRDVSVTLESSHWPVTFEHPNLRSSLRLNVIQETLNVWAFHFELQQQVGGVTFDLQATIVHPWLKSLN